MVGEAIAPIGAIAIVSSKGKEGAALFLFFWLVFLPICALIDSVKLRKRIIKKSYVSKLSEPTLLSNRGHPFCGLWCIVLS